MKPLHRLLTVVTSDFSTAGLCQPSEIQSMLQACINIQIRRKLSAKLKFSHRLHRAGFTLMELILVLGVLVVLTAITLPGVLRWQRAMPMEQAVSMLQLQLQETRVAAIRSGEAWSLILPHASEPGRRQPLTTSQKRIQQHSFRIPAGIRCEIIESAGAANQRSESARQIVFQPDGTVCACRVRITTDTGVVTILLIHRMTGMTTVVQIRVREQRPKSGVSAIASEWPKWRSKGVNVRGLSCDSGELQIS